MSCNIANCDCLETWNETSDMMFNHTHHSSNTLAFYCCHIAQKVMPTNLEIEHIFPCSYCRALSILCTKTVYEVVQLICVGVGYSYSCTPGHIHVYLYVHMYTCTHELALALLSVFSANLSATHMPPPHPCTHTSSIYVWLTTVYPSCMGVRDVWDLCVGVCWPMTTKLM